MDPLVRPFAFEVRLHPEHQTSLFLLYDQMIDDIANEGARRFVSSKTPLVGVLPVRITIRKFSVRDVPTEIRVKAVNYAFRIRCQAHPNSRAQIYFVRISRIRDVVLIERKAAFTIDQSCYVLPA